MKKSIIAVLICAIIIFSACSAAKEVSIHDIESIRVPDEVISVDELDIDTAISFLMMEHGIYTDKSKDSETIEDGDIVDVTAGTLSGEKSELVLFIGTDIEPELEASVLGKRVGFECAVEDSALWSSIRVNRIMEYAEELSDAIATEYFNGKSVSEIRQETEADIAAHRYFEYVVAQLIEHSTVSGYDKEMTEYANRVSKKLTQVLSQSNESLSEYVSEEYGLTLKDFEAALRENYREYLILRKVIEDAGQAVAPEEYSGYLTYYAEAWGLDAKDAEELFGQEYIYLQVYLDMLFNIVQQSRGLE